MEMLDGALRVGPFLAVTLGIIVLFAGKRLNGAIGFLREFSIPEPVTGGGCCSACYSLSSMPFLEFQSNLTLPLEISCSFIFSQPSVSTPVSRTCWRAANH